MEIFIYFAVLFVAYLIWIKIKAFFTGRSFTDQINHDDARKKERVCRNCKHCVLGTSCEYFDGYVDANNEVCDLFESW